MKMETILINIEELIDDLERDENLTRTEITETLYKIKEEIEQYKIREEEHPSIDWDDLDNY